MNLSGYWLGDAVYCLPRPKACPAVLLLHAARALPGVLDVVLTETHLALYCDPRRPLTEPGTALNQAIQGSAGAAVPPPREHRIRVRYNGPDLQEVAATVGCTPAALIAQHCAPRYRVAMLGFLPGFGYLRGLPAALQLPRRASPRARIPAGSVAIGGPYSAIYPCASPGGWHLLGQVEDWQPLQTDRATLAADDWVRFVPLT